MKDDVYAPLKRGYPHSVRRNFLLSSCSSWGIGGPADCFIEARGDDHLRAVMKYIRSASIQFVVIGRGTNILFDDAGFRGCVIRLGIGMSGVDFQGDTVEVQAGCWVPSLVMKVGRRGLGGLEHAIGIPASLGGLICMNGGSQRKSISELVSTVTVLSPNGDFRTDDNQDCHFGYRESIYQSTGDIVVKAVLSFDTHRPYCEQRNSMVEILRDRRKKFPRKLASCGSVFKSSPELFRRCGPPGKVIEELGLAGASQGQVEVSLQHANFIVNKGGGKSADVLSLVAHVSSAVEHETGIVMQAEFVYLHPVLGLVGVP